jgi:ferrochelatase
VPEDARLVFTAHSIPHATQNRCGPDLYSRQVAYASRLVAAAAGYDDYDQVWQSRSGPPQVPWLEPDIADHLTALADAGTTAVIVCPIGFVADHIEVVWDLDHELRQQAQELGIAFARAATPNADPRFARLSVDLIDELREGRAPARVPGPDAPPLQGFSVNGVVCTPNCG